MTNHQRILDALCRVAETKEIDGIEHIRLARPVVADEAIDVGRETECGLSDILIVNDGKTL